MEADGGPYTASQVTQAFNAWKYSRPAPGIMPPALCSLFATRRASRRTPHATRRLLHAARRTTHAACCTCTRCTASHLHVCTRMAIGRTYNNRDGEALELRAFAANAPLVAAYLPPPSVPPPPPPASSTAAFAAAFAAMMQSPRERTGTRTLREETVQEAVRELELVGGSGPEAAAESAGDLDLAGDLERV